MRISRRFQRSLLAAALLALAVPVKAADVDKCLPDDTEFVLVVNVKQIIDAPLIQKHALEHLKAFLKGNSDVTTILDSLGFDPFKDLSEITVAGNGLSSDMKGLIIAHGQFDIAKFEKKAEEAAKENADFLKIVKEGDRKLYELHPPGDKTVIVGLIDKTTIAAAPEKESVLDAFAKAAGKKKVGLKKEMQALIEKADAKQSLWFATTANALAKGELATEEKAKKNLEKMEHITAGLTISKDVKFQIAIAAKNADAAKEIAEEIKDGLNQIKGLLALLAGNMKEIAPVVDLVGSIKLETAGSSVTLKSEVSEELIEKGLKKD